MNLPKTIKQAEKKTGNQIYRNGNFYVINYKNYSLSFCINGSEESTTNFYTKKNGFEDDHSTDYFAGTFHDSLLQGLRFIDILTKSEN